MGVMRQRSCDRLGSLMQEMENADGITEEINDGGSPTMLKGTVSAPNLTPSPTAATTTIPLAAVNNKLAKTISQYSSVRLLVFLALLAVLHIRQSSTNSLAASYRTLTKGDVSLLELPSSTYLAVSKEPDEQVSLFVDIVSVGSMTKSNFQTAQEETFRTHPSVRNYYRITELNDTDATCHTDLTYPKLQQIISYCKSPKNRRQTSHTSSLLRKLVYSPKNHTGWMCAQKRPIDGLYIALQQYMMQNVPIPKYLFIIDDDTYLNMRALSSLLPQNHSDVTTAPGHHNTPQLLTGCRYNYPQEEHFMFPFGGFGTIMSQSVIQNLITPINCTSSSSDGDDDDNSINDTNGRGFVKAACWRLQQNIMGELPYFRDGMTLGDLMYEYTKQLSFMQVDSWKNGQGFCFHSDHALGYFFGYYHVAVPDQQLRLALSNSSMYNTMRYEFGYTNLAGPSDGCKQIKNRCTTQSNVCHYIKPFKMHALFQKSQTEPLPESQ